MIVIIVWILLHMQVLRSISMTCWLHGDHDLIKAWVNMETYASLKFSLILRKTEFLFKNVIDNFLSKTRGESETKYGNEHWGGYLETKSGLSILRKYDSIYWLMANWPFPGLGCRALALSLSLSVSCPSLSLLPPLFLVSLSSFTCTCTHSLEREFGFA